MRKKNREITDKAEMESLIRKAEYAVLSMCDGNKPYAVPVNIAWDKGRVYVHCALEGRKLDVLRANPAVQLTLVADAGLVRGKTPCDCTTHYRSVCIEGRACVLTHQGDADAHLAGLASLAGAYGFDSPEFAQGLLARTAVICIEPEHMTGKRNP